MNARSIRTFIGSKDYKVSRAFYHDLGFEEIEIGDKMCYFKVNATMGFYLQKYYVKDWIDNSMIFLEVEDVDATYQALAAKKLIEKYDMVRLTEIKSFDWGRECFLHDPSGVLWHFGEFNTRN